MDLTSQDLSQYLLAAGSAFSQDGKAMHLVSEQQSQLIEKVWTGTYIVDQNCVAENVRKDTSALYLNAEQRIVFFVGHDDTLRCAVFDDDEGEWADLDLVNGSDLVIHPGSRISGFVDEEAPLLPSIVIFHDRLGELRHIRVFADGTWCNLASIPVDAAMGTPHCTFSGNGVLYVFYICRDNTLHCFTCASNGKENDVSLCVSGDIQAKSITNFLVIPREDGRFEYFLSSTERLIYVDRNGVSTLLGYVSQGRFTPASSQECIIESIILIKRGFREIKKMLEKRK